MSSIGSMADPNGGAAAAARPSTALAFAAALAGSAGWRLVPALAVALALALTEGAGLILLVPLLGTIGLVVGEGSTSGMARWAQRAFELAGVAPSLPAVLVVFLGVSLLYATLYRWHLLLTPAIEQQFVLGLRERLYAAIVSARWSFLVQRRMSNMAHALLSDIERVSGAAHQMLTLVAGSAVALIYIGVAARISPGLTMLVGAGGVLTLWLVRERSRRSAERSEAVSEANRRVYAMVTESLAALKVAKSVGAEARDVDVYRGLIQVSSSRYLELLRSFADAKRRLDLASALGAAVLLLVAVLQFDIRGPGLLLIIFVFARVMPRMLSLQGSAQLFLSGMPAFAHVTGLIAECEAEAERGVGGEGARRDLGQSLTFEAVSFSYTSTTPPVLDRMTLTLDAGRTTALVGASGAGKSTVADLAMGLLLPTTGRVLVDRAPLTAGLLDAWRRSIGYVPQDGFLFHDTIRHNMLWACPAATDDAIWRCLETAAATSFVSKLADGLDTVVGDRGVRLSGGERQRLALARALLSRPSLLILDEATSALDAANEQQILDAVARLHGTLTILLITHRLSSVHQADAIHVLSGGRIVESGTWRELSALDGAFRALWRTQGLAHDGVL
jgi:ATP-binding cassette, subfamily C, bacterial